MAAQNNKNYLLKNLPHGSVIRFDEGHPTWFDQRGDLFYIETARSTRNTEAKVPEASKVTDFIIDNFNYNI